MSKLSIIDTIIKARNGHYVHAVEVETASDLDLEGLSDSIYDEFARTHTKEEIIEFLSTLQIYVLDDSKSDDRYFDFKEYIESL